MLHAPANSHESIEPRFEAFLAAGNLVESSELDRARSAAAAAGTRLDQALVDLGLVTQIVLVDLLGSLFGVRDVSLVGVPSERLFPQALKPEYLAEMRMIPWALEGEHLLLAMCDPFDDFSARAVSLKLERPVIRRRLSSEDFRSAFATLYGGRYLDAADTLETIEPTTDLADVEVLRDAASDAPVVRFVQDVIRDAVVRGASDVHLRPGAKGAELHFRLLGQLVAQPAPDARLLPSIISRLKVLAGLDISERRLPQDGRIRTSAGGRPVDLRLSTMPHVRGEAAVVRILTGEIAATSIADLGFSTAIEQGLRQLFDAQEGLVLVTGPTGSGKTTTLHAGLRQLMRPELNVVTVEDPVEYRLEGAAQVQVDEKVGLTFEKVLRSLLRQDPDVILVGEIRDRETARIAVQAALTGHLVLATLHTDSALAAVPRLIDMGVEPYLLPSVLRGVVAQRLARRLCPRCSQPASQPGEKLSEYRDRGAGCAHCEGSGYAGRIAIGELALLTAELTAALCVGNVLSDDLQRRLASSGYRPLQTDARERVARGDIALADSGGSING